MIPSNQIIRWDCKFLAKEGKNISINLFRREDCLGTEAYKRVQEFAAKQYEFTPKVLTPGIFGKTLQQVPTLNQANKMRIC